MLKSRTIVRLLNTSQVRGRTCPKIRFRNNGLKSGVSAHPSRLCPPSATPPQRHLTTSTPNYTTLEGDRPSNQDRSEVKTIPESNKVAMLETTASAPWLSSLPPNIEGRLGLAYLILFQLILYLDRPMELEETTQFLTALGSAPVSSESDIGRARTAIAGITRAVVHQISSIPINEPLRKEKNEIFDVFGALQALHDAYLVDDIADFRQWSEFWSRALPVLLELGYRLEQKGYGLTKEELNELYQQEKQSKGLEDR